MRNGGKRCTKEGADLLFIGRTVVSLLSVQALSVKEIAEAEFGRGGPQVPEEGKSGVLLRIMERSCACCFSAKSPSMLLFFQYSLILAKEVLLDSFAGPNYDMDSFPFCISDQVVFFSQLPNLA